MSLLIITEYSTQIKTDYLIMQMGFQCLNSRKIRIDKLRPINFEIIKIQSSVVNGYSVTLIEKYIKNRVPIANVSTS